MLVILHVPACPSIRRSEFHIVSPAALEEGHSTHADGHRARPDEYADRLEMPRASNGGQRWIC